MPKYIKINSKPILYLYKKLSFSSTLIQCLLYAHIVKMCSVRLGLLVIVLISGIAAEQYKIVDTLNGQVRGIKKTSLLNGIPFNSFKGIPYAKPPVGDLRFKVKYIFLLFVNWVNR